MKIALLGLGVLRAKLQAAAPAGFQAVAQTLYREAEAVMTISKEQYVPVDTGALRASGHVQARVVGGDSVEVTLGFGGPAAGYAAIVHEDLTKRHPVGQAKYLEIPLRARMAGMPAVMAARVRSNIQQAFQRMGNIERNIKEGYHLPSGERNLLRGMPIFRNDESNAMWSDLSGKQRIAVWREVTHQPGRAKKRRRSRRP